MRIALVILVLLVFAGCARSDVQQLAASLNASQLHVAELDGQVLSLRANLSDSQAKLNETTQDIRKYDELYAQKVAELADVQRQLAFEQLQSEKFQEFYETCDAQLAQYRPKPLLSTTYLTPSYDDLQRNSERYVGSNVKVEGEVLQVTQRDDGTFVLRVAIMDKGYYWTDAVWVEYTGQRVLENDLVTVAGRFEGLTTYQAVLGNAITLPKITADSVSVTVKATDR